MDATGLLGEVPDAAGSMLNTELCLCVLRQTVGQQLAECQLPPNLTRINANASYPLMPHPQHLNAPTAFQGQCTNSHPI